jgi:hypothetical protein
MMFPCGVVAPTRITFPGSSEPASRPRGGSTAPRAFFVECLRTIGGIPWFLGQESSSTSGISSCSGTTGRGRLDAIGPDFRPCSRIRRAPFSFTQVWPDHSASRRFASTPRSRRTAGARPASGAGSICSSTASPGSESSFASGARRGVQFAARNVAVRSRSVPSAPARCGAHPRRESMRRSSRTSSRSGGIPHSTSAFWSRVMPISFRVSSESRSEGSRS